MHRSESQHHALKEQNVSYASWAHALNDVRAGAKCGDAKRVGQLGFDAMIHTKVKPD